MSENYGLKGWNYRIVKKKANNNTLYYIYEVYYDDKGDIHSWSDAETMYVQESLEDFWWLLEKLSEAMKKPMLELVEDNGKEWLREAGG